MHERISVEETDDHLRIKVRWRSGYLLPLTVTFFAGSMCFSCGSTAASSIGWFSGPRENASSVVFLVNSILLVVVCYGITAFWLNFTAVDVTKDHVLVHSEPIPFPYPRGTTLPTSNVLQLFVERSGVCDTAAGQEGVGGGGATRFA